MIIHLATVNKSVITPVVRIIVAGCLLMQLPLARAADHDIREKLLVDPELSIFASFDESFQPDVSLTSGNALLEGNETQVSGVVGNAMSLEGSENAAMVAYPFENNLDLKHGTIMFWFRPQWDGSSEDGRFTLLWITMKNPDRYFGIHRSFAQDNKKALFFNFQWDNVLQVPTSSYFKSGDWLHIAVTWNSETDQYALYIDGSLVTDSAWKDISTDGEYSPKSLLLGRFYRGEKADDPINASYDELYVFKRSLSPSEIGQYFESIKHFKGQ